MHDWKQKAISGVILLLWGFFFLFISDALGDTYYVDALKGNNKQRGTSKVGAWRTIQRALMTARAGDSVFVQPGIYPERIKCIHSGKPGKQILIQSVPKHAATINGGIDVGKDYVRVEGFRITSDVKGRSAVNISGGHVEIIDNYFFNVKGRAIQGDEAKKPRGVHISNNHIYHSQVGIVVHGTGWLVENNEVERLFKYDDMDCDYARFFGDDNIFRNNYFHGTNEGEIGDAHVDCFQTWHNSPTRYAHNTTIEYNRCADFHQGLMAESGGNPTSISHITLRNNVFSHARFTSGGYGIHNSGIPDVTVINNNFIDIKYRGVYSTEGTLRSEVKYNIFYKCGLSYSYHGSSSDGDYNIIFLTPQNPNRGPHDMIGVDPLFIDPDNDNFHLRPESPACRPRDEISHIGAYPCASSVPD
jgi:Right handed beta helix region